MTDGSVTHWIGQVKEGGESLAEQGLWERYFYRLAALARGKLVDLPPGVRDGEDVALSAMNSFFLRAKRGDFSRLHDRTDLWQLLAKITVRKAIDRRRIAQAQKRGAGLIAGDMECTDELLEIARREPTPAMLAAFNEQYQQLMNTLDPGLRTIALKKLEGYSNREIAQSMGRVERTVERKLERIRNAWLKQLKPP